MWFMRTLYWAGGDAYFPMVFSTTMLLLDAILAVAMWHDGHRARWPSCHIATARMASSSSIVVEKTIGKYASPPAQ